MTPKYLYSKGLKKSQVLFGNNHVTPQPFICVTEGCLDTMWLDQHGYTSVALLGANASRVQQEKLLQLPTNEIVLCLDNDEAGSKATENLQLMKNVARTWRQSWRSGIDSNDKTLCLDKPWCL